MPAEPSGLTVSLVVVWEEGPLLVHRIWLLSLALTVGGWKEKASLMVTDLPMAAPASAWRKSTRTSPSRAVRRIERGIGSSSTFSGALARAAAKRKPLRSWGATSPSPRPDSRVSAREEVEPQPDPPGDDSDAPRTCAHGPAEHRSQRGDP